MTDRVGRQERGLGSLLAFAVGDALGASAEFMTPEEIKAEYGVHRDIIGGGWLKLEPGQITDDTEMMLCVARSLVACGGYNLPDIAAHFVEWYNSEPLDIGRTVSIGINRHIRTGRLEAPYAEDSAGNGGVMRALPLILAYADQPETMQQAVVEQSRLTHNNEESDEGCRCYASLVAAALQGADKQRLLEIARRYPRFEPGKFDGKSGGYIVDTLRTVLHGFFVTDSLEGCIVTVTANGGDADTTAALAGGLAGAYYGVGAIPDRWLKTLDVQVRAKIESFSPGLSRFLQKY